ncbi:pyridoxal-phosphate dependent enzyme [Brevibacillus gelatini]
MSNKAFFHWDALTSHPTPIVRFNLSEMDILAKIEYLQPGGSVKRRIGMALLKDMIKTGELTEHTQYVVEATAGNTAIALAEGLRELGLSAKVVAVVKDKLGSSKIERMKQFGVIPYLVPSDVSSDRADGLNPHMAAMKEVCRLYPNSVEAGQFVRDANPRAHELSTGAEIVKQLVEQPDAIILGVGTGGTLTGITRAIRKAGWDSKIVLADPVGSIIGPTWLGEKKPRAKPTIVEGIGHDIVPPLLDLSLIDDVVMVPDEETLNASVQLARAGFSVGTSSACAWVAARTWARHQKKE